jgi:hypothetical protein
VRHLAPLLFLALTGCSSGIPSHVQPEEYAIYHAFLMHYAAKNPSETEHLYTFNQVSGSTFLTGERQARRQGAYGKCITQEADDAFWKVNNKRYSLNQSNQQWRTLPGGKVIAVLANGGHWPIPRTTIGFSRVFFDRSGQDAYLHVSVGYCSSGCGGHGIIWHAVREGGGWRFTPTACGEES